MVEWYLVISALSTQQANLNLYENTQESVLSHGVRATVTPR